MESPAVASHSLECGDGWPKFSEMSSDETESSSANQRSSPVTYFSLSSESGSGLIASGKPPPAAELADPESAVSEAADSLCCLQLDAVESVGQSSSSVAAANCTECCEKHASSEVCGCVAVETSTDSAPAEFCSCTSGYGSDATVAELSSDYIGSGKDTSMLPNDMSPSHVELKGDSLESGATSNCPVADGDSSRCRHATSDSCSSTNDYASTGRDVVFSDGMEYRPYGCERHLGEIMDLVSRDLSEPYSIYTYRYFIYNWPNLCFRALDVDRCVGAIVCKLHVYQDSLIRGYIAMLAVDKGYRRRGIATQLVLCAVKAMMEDNCNDVVLEAELDNSAALRLYENLGFIRDKRLHKYYLNGHDAFRLHLLLD